MTLNVFGGVVGIGFGFFFSVLQTISHINKSSYSKSPFTLIGQKGSM